jgi:Aminoacyl-tRNA editing domain
MSRSAEKLLKESGVGFLTHRWRPFTSFDELLARQGTHQVVKTVVVDAPDGLVLVALRAEDDLDYGKLARALGAIATRSRPPPPAGWRTCSALIRASSRS